MTNPTTPPESSVPVAKTSDEHWDLANPSDEHGDLIPENLLSLAKDVRYIQQCQILLQKILESFRLRGIPEARLHKDSWLLSSILYIIFVIFPNGGRTMGMDTCGLRFEQSPSRIRLVGSFLISICGIYSFQRFIENPVGNAIGNQNDVAHNSDNREALRGDERRRAHEILRQRMLQRSQASTSEDTRNPVQSPESTQENSSATLGGRGISQVVTTLKSLADAFLSSPMEGPHALARRNDGTQQSTLSIGMWIIRLHLAQYCITGKYPTWFHRLTGLSMVETRDNTSMTKCGIPCRPSTYRSVGLLIFTQAALSLLQKASNSFCRYLVDHLERRRLTSGHKQAPVSSLFPSIQASSTIQDGSSGRHSGVTCAICRVDRTHPAAPSGCGHVCCWSCLMQWVSAVRPECPLCRSPCRPQDIIALHDYAPHS